MIDAETIRTWRINYGLDTRTPEQAMRWWSGEMHGCAPAGAVAALGLCLDEIDRLRAENSKLRRSQSRDVHYVCAQCGWTLSAEPPSDERREG